MSFINMLNKGSETQFYLQILKENLWTEKSGQWMIKKKGGRDSEDAGIVTS